MPRLGFEKTIHQRNAVHPRLAIHAGDLPLIQRLLIKLIKHQSKHVECAWMRRCGLSLQRQAPGQDRRPAEVTVHQHTKRPSIQKALGRRDAVGDLL
jgi:hypothetical protein